MIELPQTYIFDMPVDHRSIEWWGRDGAIERAHGYIIQRLSRALGRDVHADEVTWTEEENKRTLYCRGMIVDGIPPRVSSHHEDYCK